MPDYGEYLSRQREEADDSEKVFYHGGLPGRTRVSFHLPPSFTKVRSMSELGSAGIHRKDRVYVTTCFDAALMFACAWRHGVVYQVEPDPDCNMPGLSWQGEKVRVRRIIKPKSADLEMARVALIDA